MQGVRSGSQAAAGNCCVFCSYGTVPSRRSRRRARAAHRRTESFAAVHRAGVDLLGAAQADLTAHYLEYEHWRGMLVEE
jgi:hypothetical protein